MKKHLLYLNLLKSQQDDHGFIESHECDSLLFTCLVGCVEGVEVNITAAMGEEGQWFRRPIKDKYGKIDLTNECYSCKASKSTISRDMLIGLAWYTYINNRLDISEQVIQYALSHYLVMGEGPFSRTLMSPGLLSTFAWISYRLGGPSRWWLRIIPQIESSKVTDYKAHLSVLHIMLRNKLMGNNKYKDILEYHANRNQNNALFQYAAGKVDKAKEILHNQSRFPSNRLPEARDRKGPWLWERDYGSNYEPSNKPKIHSGGDYLFVSELIRKKFQ